MWDAGTRPYDETSKEAKRKKEKKGPPPLTWKRTNDKDLNLLNLNPMTEEHGAVD